MITKEKDINEISRRVDTMLAKTWGWRENKAVTVRDAREAGWSAYIGAAHSHPVNVPETINDTAAYVYVVARNALIKEKTKHNNLVRLTTLNGDLFAESFDSETCMPKEEPIHGYVLFLKKTTVFGWHTNIFSMSFRIRKV